MRLQLFLTSVIFIWTFQIAFSQQVAEEKAVIKVIHFETESYQKRDSIIWKKQFVQNEKTTRDLSFFTYSESYVGLQNIGPEMLQWIP